MMLAHDRVLDRSRQATHMVVSYGRLHSGDAKSGAKGLLTRSLPTHSRKPPPKYDHARAYWCGDGRLIDDLRGPPRPDLEPRRPDLEPRRPESVVGAKIRELAAETYADALDARRLEAHVALAERRFDEKRQRLSGVLAARHDAALEAFVVRTVCSVDELTARAFVAAARDAASRPPLPELYTAEPAPTEPCAAAIAALLDP
jgi:hypothetical protein